MKGPSRLYRWTLLGASLLTIGYLVAAAVRENYLAEWQRHQRTYREKLQAKATDGPGRALLRNFRVELRQISVPPLQVVDRCVSCHVGIDDPRMIDVPQPLAGHPGDTLKHHPPDRFGCTICHHGQGPATTFRDAKADDVFWDYPLLSAELTQSSCLACHDAERLPQEQVSLLSEGIELYRGKSCGACHKLGGRGGTLGAALDNEGAKTRHQLIMTNLKPPYTAWRWHQAHFRDPGGVVTGSQMKNPTLTERQVLALTVYMLALWPRDVPESYLAPDKLAQKYRTLHPQPLAGEQSYRQYCFACHGDGTYGRWDNTFKRFIPAIRGPSLVATASPAYFETSIAKGRPGTQMPSWEAQAGGLQPMEITAVVEYLRAGVARSAPASIRVVRGDVTRGAALYAQNCAGCHGAAGRGGIAPELANPSFQQAASDEFITATIRNGRRATAMPAFQRAGTTGLSDAEIGDLVAFIRSLAPGVKGTVAAQAKNEPHKAGGAL